MFKSTLILAQINPTFTVKFSVIIENDNQDKFVTSIPVNKFKYGLIIKGKPSKTMMDDYKTLTIKDMDKYQTGICWDFVNYQHYIFNKKNQFN